MNRSSAARGPRSGTKWWMATKLLGLLCVGGHLFARPDGTPPKAVPPPPKAAPPAPPLKGAAAAAAVAPVRPRLVLVISIDQMRYDYLDRFSKLFTGGF